MNELETMIKRALSHKDFNCLIRKGPWSVSYLPNEVPELRVWKENTLKLCCCVADKFFSFSDEMDKDLNDRLMSIMRKVLPGHLCINAGDATSFTAEDRTVLLAAVSKLYHCTENSRGKFVLQLPEKPFSEEVFAQIRKAAASLRLEDFTDHYFYAGKGSLRIISSLIDNLYLNTIHNCEKKIMEKAGYHYENGNAVPQLRFLRSRIKFQCPYRQYFDIPVSATVVWELPSISTIEESSGAFFTHYEHPLFQQSHSKNLLSNIESIPEDSFLHSFLDNMNSQDVNAQLLFAFCKMTLQEYLNLFQKGSFVILSSGTSILCHHTAPDRDCNYIFVLEQPLKLDITQVLSVTYMEDDAILQVQQLLSGHSLNRPAWTPIDRIDVKYPARKYAANSSFRAPNSD